MFRTVKDEVIGVFTTRVFDVAHHEVSDFLSFGDGFAIDLQIILGHGKLIQLSLLPCHKVVLLMTLLAFMILMVREFVVSPLPIKAHQ